MTKSKKILLFGLITSCVILVSTFIITLFLQNENNAYDMFKLKYIVTFFTLTGFLNGTVLIREYLEKNYDKKKYIIKLTISIIYLLIGGVLLFIVDSSNIIMGITFGGLVVLLYSLSKSN